MLPVALPVPPQLLMGLLLWWHPLRHLLMQIAVMLVMGQPQQQQLGELHLIPSCGVMVREYRLLPVFVIPHIL